MILQVKYALMVWIVGDIIDQKFRGLARMMYIQNEYEYGGSA